MKKTLCVLLMMLGLASTLSASEFINISTDNTSLIIGPNAKGDLLIYHYGGKVKEADFYGWHNSRRTNDRIDAQAYPAAGARYYGESALSATYADGAVNTELKFTGVKVENPSDGLQRTTVTLSDPKTALEVALVYDAYKAEDVIVCHSEITNGGKKQVVLRNYYSSCMHIRAEKYLLSHFYGTWAREFNMDNTLLTHGTKSIESKVGVRTTHLENPSFMLSLDTESFNENYGEVIAGALAWSGNFRLNFEMDADGEVNILGGINPYAAEYPLKHGEKIVTPDMIYTYSNRGAGQASRNLHDWARRADAGIHTQQMVPTLLNSWEGAYFDFDMKTLTTMVDDAASMGLEMFVLDDGWFGNKYPRNNDKQGLGDWDLNTSKLPEGIDYLARYTHDKGLKFGIWIEPEMVNPKSELFEKHPDWVVGETGRENPLQRNQLLLDLSNPAVQDFVFDVFDKTMALSPAIDYIKWDANRHVDNVGSNYLKTQTTFWVKYCQGFYNVVERIRAKYPDVMIQACSSGGGRVEYGALRYFDEFWTSDNTEARQRVKIQYGTNMIYPAIVTGSHVSAVPNHQTGNITPLKFRFDIACAGRLGMELQPRSMTEEERTFAKRAIESYKGYRDLVQNGDLYRIKSPYTSDFYALMYVSKDKKRAVVFAYTLEYQSRIDIPHFRLWGLDPDMKYTIRELNVDKSSFWADGKTLSGDYLIEEGINPYLVKMYSSAIYYLEAK